MGNITFDPFQQEAVEHGYGPLLCLAGPGSGKTTVITGRVRALLGSGLARPQDILVITFTQAAAREMENRFYKLCPEVIRGQLLFSTFHALFFRILRVAYGYTSANIISNEHKNKIFKDIMSELKLEIEDEQDYIAKLQSEIGLVKSEGMRVENYYPLTMSKDTFEKAYRMYEAAMIKENLIDFDDMQVLCYELLTKRKDILKRWQERFKFILVDESQDTNLLQYRLICMLAAPENNLMLVGDDDQSIYRFRGARPEIMLNFPKDYPDTKKVYLGINYRCAGNIVDAAAKLIADNSMRFKKKLSAREGAEEGNIYLNEYIDPSEESRQILARIMEKNSKGLCFEDMAVLFRTNLAARNTVDELLRAGIPMNLHDVIPNLYEHWIFKDIRTYINLARGDRDRTLFLAIANRPKRYFSRDAFLESRVSMVSLMRYYNDKAYMQERVEKLFSDIRMLAGMRPYAAVHYIRYGIAYEDYIKEYASGRNMKADDFFEVFDEIEADAGKYKSYEEWFEAADRITEELKLKAEELKKSKKDNKGVSIMTYHSSKGLEFDTCFLPGVNDGVIPYHKAGTEAEIEEERRMLYVAMTRAAKNLYISWTQKRFGKEVHISPFLIRIFGKEYMKSGEKQK